MSDIKLHRTGDTDDCNCPDNISLQYKLRDAYFVLTFSLLTNVILFILLMKALPVD